MKNILLRRFYSLSLRTTLLLMAFVLSLPSFILIFYSGYLQSEEAIHEGFDDGRMLVYSIASELHNLSDNIEQLLTALAQIPEIKNHDVAAANTILADILKKNTQFGNIIIADPAGNVWASGLPLKTPVFVKDRRSFQNVVKTGQFSSGEYGIGSISAKPTIGFGYPITNARGVLIAVILANINFVRLNELLTMAGLPKDSSFSIIDRNGIIVDRNPNPGQSIGTKINGEIFQGMVNGPEADNSADHDSTDEKFINCYRKLRLKSEQSPYLYIRASIPHKETQKKARLVLVNKVAFLTPFVLFTMLIVIRFGNICFLKRIDKLQNAVQRLAGGDLQFRVADAVEGGEFGRLGQAFDAMAQKLTARELALVKSEHELSDLYNNAPCGYHSLDREGYFVRINDTELNWLGYSRDELIGHMKFADIVSPDGSEVLEKSFQLLKNLGRAHGIEFELVRKDGSKLPVLLNATALRDQDGSLLVIRSTVHDIADRKQVERELNELNTNLTKRIDEETERRVQHERLLARHARLVAMGEMIGAIAHQWRQPLATIGATIQSIRMAWERNCIDKSFLERAEADAQKQLYHMSDTIEDFRNFFLPEKVIELFDLREKIDEVVLLVSSQFTNSGVKLHVIDNSPGCRLTVKGYQNEFKQSLINLVSNAFDAIIDKITLNNQLDKGIATDGQVIISVAGEVNKAVIEVLDNGCGIPDECADKVFDPYFTTKSADKGTGIGLYMTKLIIEESMGGHLCFESGPDGTKFKIELAREDSEEGDSNG